MVRQKFHVEDYWKVIVYYDVDYDFFFPIFKDLERIGIPQDSIYEIYHDLISRKALAITCSNLDYCTSIVLFNKHSSKSSYINSIAHEAEHVKQAMLEAYSIEDEGEDPAYTLGYLIGKMYYVFKELICSL